MDLPSRVFIVKDCGGGCESCGLKPLVREVALPWEQMRLSMMGLVGNFVLVDASELLRDLDRFRDEVLELVKLGHYVPDEKRQL